MVKGTVFVRNLPLLVVVRIAAAVPVAAVLSFPAAVDRHGTLLLVPGRVLCPSCGTCHLPSVPGE